MTSPSPATAPENPANPASASNPVNPVNPVNIDTLAAIDLLDIQLNLLWRRTRAMNYMLTKSVHPDLDPAAYGLLSVLLNQGGMRLTELSRYVGVGKPSVSRQITLLAGLGLVHKLHDPRDGRAQLIELTPAGVEKMESLHAGRQSAFQDRLKHWNDAELTQLALMLAKLNADYVR